MDGVTISIRRGERVTIGDGPDAIVVTITDIERTGNRCRVGIIAPKFIPIVRGELPHLAARAIRERAAGEA